MVNIKFLVVLGLLLAISLNALADKSQDQTHSEDVKAVDNVEPQRTGCRYGCCGKYAHGQCSACCGKPNQQAVEGNVDGKNDVIEPQQRGGCRRGCCGSYAHGQCSFCCPEKNEIVEPQQRGGCRRGCCGSYAHGQCSFCCPEKNDVVEPQQRGGCRRGCCGSYAHGQCSFCCP